MNRIAGSAFLLSACILHQAAFAQTPQLLNLQGRLVDGSGLLNGNVSLSLRLFDAPTLGSLLYEDSNTVAVVDGLYSTFIGDNTASGSLVDALTNAQVFLEIAVNGTAQLPRERVVAVAYSLATRGLLVDTNVPPNVILGAARNIISSGARGAVIAGGSNNTISAQSDYSSIAGGLLNGIGTNSDFAAVGGGIQNNVDADSQSAVIAGGYFNDIFAGSGSSSVGGGYNNNVAGNSAYGTIAGGDRNNIGVNAPYASIPGGRENAVGNNAANAFAAGRRARANHRGAFVWADDTDADFTSTTNNQFLVRASGGVGIGTTNTAGGMLTVAGNVLITGTLSTAKFVGDGSMVSNIQGNAIADGSLSSADIAVNTFWSTTGNAGTSPGTHVIGTTDGAALRIVAAGGVGIGTTTPDDALDVEGSSPNIRIGNSAETESGLSFVDRDDPSNQFARIRFDANGLANHNLNVYVDGTNPIVTVKGNSRVGIGTPNPAGTLDVVMGVNRSVLLRDDSGLVPALVVPTTGTYAGIMRYRNSLEIWPNDAGTKAGFLDVRDTNGVPIIILNGATGEGTVKVLTITGGADIAEPFPMAVDGIPEGSVVVIDDEHPGALKPSDRAYDSRVAGIVSGANGVKPGIALHQQGRLEGGRNVALTGRVYVLADAADGPIKPGDLLTTANLPGHAMAVRDRLRAQGAIIGKAMSRLDHGQGLVLVLVSLQ